MEPQSIVIGIVIGLVYAYGGLVAVVVAEEHTPGLSTWVGESCARGIAVLLLWMFVLTYFGVRRKVLLRHG